MLSNPYKISFKITTLIGNREVYDSFTNLETFELHDVDVGYQIPFKIRFFIAD